MSIYVGISNVNYFVRSRQLPCPVIGIENQALLTGMGAHRNEAQYPGKKGLNAGHYSPEKKVLLKC